MCVFILFPIKFVGNADRIGMKFVVMNLINANSIDEPLEVFYVQFVSIIVPYA